MNHRMLPLGIDRFEKLRADGFYYIDKTGFIEDLLSTRFEVNLITRPRRFGKTLTMSMLADFFDIRKDSRELFKGLKITENQALCDRWMNQYPVLFFTLKDVEDLTFAGAYEQLEFMVSGLCIEHNYLATSDCVDETDKKLFESLKNQCGKKSSVKNSLLILTRMMQAHYNKPVILLIDEYDVPLAKAYEHRHYKQMLAMIKGVLSAALKSNKFLQFAVVTGCLRIAKESIFTGTNHFVTNSILTDEYADVFGFSVREVEQLLTDFDVTDHAGEMKSWYDGYRIGKEEIYCPWDVLNYVKDLRRDPGAVPQSYWKDTSHNDIIRSFIGQENFNVTDKLEVLLAGGYLKVRLSDNLTYDLVHSSEENFWSILYLTGYLTVMRPEEIGTGDRLEAGETALRIPNEEVKAIFADTIIEWFKDSMKETNRKPLMDALWGGEENKASAILTDYLFQTISYHNYKEDFYHAFLAGIFVGLGLATESDKEHGNGRPDVVVKDNKNRRVIIIEVKISDSKEQMESDCAEAVDQIATQNYVRDFLEGYKTIVCFGASFYKKECLIRRIEL